MQNKSSTLMEITEKLTNEIAERKQAEKKLEISEGRFRILVENSTDWIWETDSAGIFSYTSPKVETLLGYSPDEVIGKTPFDFMVKHEAQQLLRSFEIACFHKKAISRMRNINRHKDGRLVVLEKNAEPIIDTDGRLLGFCGIDRDITEREKTEEENLKQRNLESLGILAGGIAHDFNNLLTALVGNIELAMLELNSAENAYLLLEKACGAIDKTKQLTGQLLTFSKGDETVKEPVGMSQLLAETGRYALSGSEIKCEFRIPKNLWTVNVDRIQIWQVLHNLIMNASESMSGEGRIRISAENIEMDEQSPSLLTDGRYVRVTVADVGKGIPDYSLSKIFDPYYSTKNRGSVKGTGLGLSICHSVIKRHNGYITLKSMLNQGTEVSFYLPVSDEQFFSYQPLELKPKIKSERKKRILLLDDDEAIINTVPGMLNYLGYDFEIAWNGQMAVESYERSLKAGIPFDLVILDLTDRSGLGGIETNRRLQKIDPSVTSVVASGYTDDEAIIHYQDYGFKAAIKKPYSLATLSEIIQKLI